MLPCHASSLQVKALLSPLGCILQHIHADSHELRLSAHSLAHLHSLKCLQGHQDPLLQDELTTEKLTEAFDFLKDPSAKKAAQEIAGKIATEDGVAAGVEVGSCL